MDMHPHEQSLCTCSVPSLHMRSINLLLDIPRIYGKMGMSADRIFISPALALTKIRLCVLGMQFSRYDAARKTSRLVNTAGVEPASCPLLDVFCIIFMKEANHFAPVVVKSGSRLLSRAVSSKVPSAA